MYISLGMLAVIVLGAFGLGVLMPIFVVARALSRRGRVYARSEEG